MNKSRRADGEEVEAGQIIHPCSLVSISEIECASLQTIEMTPIPTINLSPLKMVRDIVLSVSPHPQRFL